MRTADRGLRIGWRIAACALGFRLVSAVLALLINVSNYVYANPIGYGTGQNFEDLRTRLINRLQFPNTQITEVSDGMRRPPGLRGTC